MHMFTALVLIDHRANTGNIGKSHPPTTQRPQDVNHTEIHLQSYNLKGMFT